MTVKDITQIFIPAGRRDRPGTKLRATSVTIHNTFNTARGADAAAHARALYNGSLLKEYLRSWHFTVDDVSIYQHVPTNEVAYHANSGNGSSIGIEICENSGLNVAAAYDNAAWLAARLLHQIGQTPANGLKQHFDWSGKDCPRVLRESRNGWPNFISAVASHYSQMSGAAAGPRALAVTKRAGKARPAGGATRATKDMVAALRQHEAHSLVQNSVAQKIPVASPLKFAGLAPGPCYWPTVSLHANAYVVPADLDNNTSVGPPFRRFLAPRPVDGPQARYHVGVDLAGNEGDTVLAIQQGKIVAFYPFYTRANGDVTYALFVAHDGYVANYGEVLPDSLKALGLKIGSVVDPGQPIGRVSGTRMIHFETYAPGTTVNKRWPLGAKPPAGLLNPTQLLLDVQANGTRVDTRGVALEAAVPAMPAYRVSSGQAVAPAQAAMPYPSTSNWHRFGSLGREWRYDARGLYTRDVGGGNQSWRWDASLVTVKRIWDLMGTHIEAASRKHGVNPALIIMTIATETHFASKAGFTGPTTFRWEAHVVNEDVKPPVSGDYSPGPMQTLGTTVRWIIRTKGAQYGLPYQPFTVAPVYKSRPSPAPKSHPLYDYATNIDIGTAEIRIRLGKTGDDPILVAAAYNRGSLKPDPDSDWGLKARGDHLDRAAKWYGDACALLNELGIF